MGFLSKVHPLWRRRGSFSWQCAWQAAQHDPAAVCAPPGDPRIREMLCLADWLIKSLSDGSRLIIQRPDGTLQEVNYKKKK